MKTNEQNFDVNAFFVNAIGTINAEISECASKRYEKSMWEALAMLRVYKKYFKAVDLCRYRFQKEERALVEFKKLAKTQIMHDAYAITLYYVRRARREFLAEV